MTLEGTVENGKVVLQGGSELPDGTHVHVIVDRAGLSERFRELVRQWKTATQFTSSGTEMALHPAYQQIIGMGQQAIPLILDELQREEDHWFWALRSITGEDPVAPAERGNVPQMTAAWLRWARANGYIPCG